MKRCNTCGIEKSDSDFYPREGRWLCHECKACARAKAREWAAAHREEVNARKRRERIEDPDKAKRERAKTRDWKKRNREKVREQHRRYRLRRYGPPRALLTEQEKLEHRKLYCQEHKEEIRARHRAWRKANQELLREKSRRRYHKDLAKSREASRLQHIRYRSMYPEKERAKLKRWRKNNPEKKIRQNSIDSLRRYAGVFWNPPEELVTVETKRRLLGRRIKESMEEGNG